MDDEAVGVAARQRFIIHDRDCIFSESALVALQDVPQRQRVAGLVSFSEPASYAAFFRVTIQPTRSAHPQLQQNPIPPYICRRV
jgi:hypothetical protein